MRDLERENGPGLMPEPPQQRVVEKQPHIRPGTTTNPADGFSVPRGPDTQSAEDRFFEKVGKTATCWHWLAVKTRDGYGMFWSGSRMVLAHRFGYELLVGLIPPNHELHHTCHVRDCVRPEHLSPISHAENSFKRRGAAAGSSSAWRGVSRHSNGKWQASVICKGERHYIGCFTDEVDAARAAADKYAELGYDKHRRDLERYLSSSGEMWADA